MSAKKGKGSGRVTPKGTKPPEKKKERRSDLPEPNSTLPGQLPGVVRKGKGSDRVARPVTHNRGNR